jgi:prepilin-type processing-associated H-X9-DG protein/prepilin-type N-terminal cleavage/methylation domain-containing protein
VERKRYKDTGFTLTELWVVIAIMAMLTALLTPVITRSKQRAQQAGCVGNLHQLGIGLRNFVADNHAYPSIIGPTNREYPGWWMSQLASGGLDNFESVSNVIDRGVWRCPCAPHVIPGPPVEVFCSYGYNVWGGIRFGTSRANPLGLHGNFVPGATFIPGQPGYAPVQESEVAVPSDMMAIGDSILGAVSFVRMDLGYLDKYGASRRHQGKVNVLFCDGHVESPTLSQVFEDTSDAALVRWNRDHEPHRDRL